MEVRVDVTRGMTGQLELWCFYKLEKDASGRGGRGTMRGEEERFATLSPNQEGASHFSTPSYATLPRQQARG